jgi:hypothetical protein
LIHLIHFQGCCKRFDSTEGVADINHGALPHFCVWGRKCDCVLRFLSIEFLASSWLWLDLFFVNLQGIPSRKIRGSKQDHNRT